MVKTPVCNTAVERIPQEIVNPISAEDVPADHLVQNRLPNREFLSVVFRPYRQLRDILLLNLNFREYRSQLLT